MLKSKLIGVLLQLNAYEINRLVKFIAGDTTGNGSKSAILLDHLCGWLKEDDDRLKDKSALWNVLYPNTPFEDSRFRKICTDALQHIERFLGVEAYLGDRLMEATQQLVAFEREGLDALYRTQLNRVKTLSSRIPERDANYYYHQFRIEQSTYQKSQANVERFKVADIDRIIHPLDIFYVIEKLRYYCEVLSRKTFVKHEYKNLLIKEILQLVEAGSFVEVPAISIYYQIVLTHLYPDEEEHYFALKKILHQHADVLPPEHRKEVFFSALNYCTRKINQGRDSFLRESFEMYREVLRTELIFVNGYLSHWTFKNVVVLALRLGEYAWAETFIHSFGPKIQESHRQNAVTYNLAQLYFYRKDYERVLSLLQEVEYADVTYNLGAKTMLLATYFELDEIDALQSLGESFRTYIHRKKQTIPEGRRRSYLNLIKFTLRLSNLPTGSIQSLKKLEHEIDETPEIASEQWIRQKVASRYRQVAP